MTFSPFYEQMDSLEVSTGNGLWVQTALGIDFVYLEQ